MSSNFKKALLVGTALVAVGSFPGSAHAVSQTLTGATQWANVGTPDSATTDGTTAAANDAVNVVTYTLTVANDTVNNDGSGVNTFNLGAVTGTTGGINITTNPGGTTDADLTVNIASVNLTGAGSVIVQSENADDSTVTATVAGDLTTGGILLVRQLENSTADDVSLTVNGNINITGISTINAGSFVGSDATLTLNGASNLFTGAVTFNSNSGSTALISTGAVTTFTGGVTFNGSSSTGTTTANFSGANVDFGSGATLNFTSGGSGVNPAITFSGTNAQTVAGIINGAASGEGDLVVTNTSASGTSFTGIIGGTQVLNAVSVGSGATARFGANASAVGVVNSGTVYVARNAVLTGNASGFTGSGTYYIEVNDDDSTLTIADFGQLGSSGAISLAAENVVFNVTGNVTASTSGTTMSSAFVGGGAAVAAASVTDNSGLYDFALTANGNDFDVVITKIATSALGRDTNNDNLASILDGFLGSGTAALHTLGDLFAKGGNGAAFDENLERFLPSVDAGGVDTVVDVGTQSIGVNDIRLAALRSGDQSGMVAGELGNGLEMWFQGFGKLADQDKRGNVDGFDADTFGGAVGVDKDLGDSTVGLAISYATTDVESDNANRTQSDINSYQLSLYGEQDLGDEMFVNGTLAYGLNKIDQTRYNVGGSGLAANADYDSNLYAARVGVGREMTVSDGITFTPTAMANYQHVSIEDYRETGTSGANLSVDTDSINIFELGVAGEFSFETTTSSGATLKPTIDFGYRYDLIGDAVEASSTFTAGGTAFKTTGEDPEQGKFNIGAALDYDVNSATNVKVSYDYEMKGSDYDAHIGFVRAGVKF